MRILHIVHQYLPDHVGGTELYTQNLARVQVAAGHEAVVITPWYGGTTTAETVEEGVRVVRVGVGARSRTAVFLGSFGRSLLNDAIRPYLVWADVVHVQHLMGVPLRIVDQIVAAGKRFVVTLHDYWFPCANAQLVTNYDQSVCAGPDAHWHNCGRCALARLGMGNRPILARSVAPLLEQRSRRLEKVLAQASAVIAPTEFVADIYRQTGFGGGNLRVVRHGIDVPLDLIAEAQKNVEKSAEFHVVYIGSIAQQKGPHILVEAFNVLPHDGFKLTIAGGLETFPDYAAELQAAASHPHIKFAGRVPHKDIWSLLASADVVVIPTLWYEASPLTIDEFFAAGVPIIASNLGAMTEKIRHEIDGLLFPPGAVGALTQAIRRLAADSAELASLRTQIQPVRTVEQHADEVEAVYQGILKND